MVFWGMALNQFMKQLLTILFTLFCLTALSQNQVVTPMNKALNANNKPVTNISEESINSALDFPSGVRIRSVSGNGAFIHDVAANTATLYGVAGEGMVEHAGNGGQSRIYDALGNIVMIFSTNGTDIIKTYSPENGLVNAIAITNGEVSFPNGIASPLKFAITNQTDSSVNFQNASGDTWLSITYGDPTNQPSTFEITIPYNGVSSFVGIHAGHDYTYLNDLLSKYRYFHDADETELYGPFINSYHSAFEAIRGSTTLSAVGFTGNNDAITIQQDNYDNLNLSGGTGGNDIYNGHYTGNNLAKCWTNDTTNTIYITYLVPPAAILFNAGVPISTNESSIDPWFGRFHMENNDDYISVLPDADPKVVISGAAGDGIGWTNIHDSSLIVGTNNTPPVDGTVPVAWRELIDVDGNSYRSPLYR